MDVGGLRHFHLIALDCCIMAQVPRLAQKSLANENNITGFTLLLPRVVVGAFSVKAFEVDL